MAPLSEKTRLAGLVLGVGMRTAWRRAGAVASAPLSFGRRTPERLLIAPHDLRTSDPTRAGEIYAGVFAFAGRSVETNGRSPFESPEPSPEWADALHGFGWLRHLRAADTTLARANGRALVDEWIALRGSSRAARAPHVAARRLISWFCHAPLILDDADNAFYRRFLRSISRQTRRLGRRFGETPDGAPRLAAAIALAYAGLCLSGETRLQRVATKGLADELDRQILADGGHISRNPAALVEALLDLLPLRQAFAARSLAPPSALLNAIDRMMPMLRFFRHADGDFAQFNGAGPVSPDLVASVLAYDDALGEPVQDAPHSGYQRIVEGGTVILMDAGKPPPVSVSGFAHAGCLSFEMSSGADRLIVNCGAPRFGRSDWEAAARATAAHSTAVVDDASSCRFASSRLKRLIGSPIVAGPRDVPVNRSTGQDGSRLMASHDGYAPRFGVLHERTLFLSADGRRFSGEDAFPPSPGRKPRGGTPVAIRFHLHPTVRASVRQDGSSVLLATPGGEGWVFASRDHPIELTDSVFLSGPHGPRRSEQIVIHTTLDQRVAWSLEAVDRDESPRSTRLPPAATLFGAPQAPREERPNP